MGVVVRRYTDILTIIINFPYSTCISSFLAAASLLLCSFFLFFQVTSTIIQSNISLALSPKVSLPSFPKSGVDKFQIINMYTQLKIVGFGIYSSWVTKEEKLPIIYIYIHTFSTLLPLR